MPEVDPVISVLLPVYNDARFLPRAVRSIRRQTLSAWDLLLLDDGSTDGTRALVDHLAAQDPRIRAVHLSHRGIAEALNVGLQRATAPYVARMDADDVSAPHRLSVQKAWLDDRPDLCVVGSKVRIFPRNRLTSGMRAYEAWINTMLSPEDVAREIFVESPLVHPTVLMRREAVLEAGGYQGPGPEDYDLWLRLHRRGERFAKVPEVLLWWMDRPDRATRRSPDYSREAFRRCKARHLAEVLQGHDEREILLVGNREAKRLAGLLEAAGLRISGYVDVNPRRIGTAWKGKPIVGYDDLAADPSRRRLLLAAVGSRGARETIRRKLAGLGFREPEEFICVA